MKKYVGQDGLKNVLGRVKEKLDLKADKAELAVQSNPNLLDNWYFVNPVNQRGQAEYTSAEIITYSIDRWLTQRAKAIVGSGGIVLTSTDTNGTFTQRLSDSARAAIKGQTVTLSVLLDTGLFSQTIKIPKSGNFDSPNYSVGVSGWYIDILIKWYQNFTYFRILNSSADEDAPITVIAAKLELGDHQTLAHQDADGNWVLNDPPPDYTTELLKCQRYYHVFATEDRRPTKKEDFCPPMRIDPRLETIQISGVDYYAADANL